MEAIRVALQEAIELAVIPPGRVAYHKCQYCECTWFGEMLGRTNPEPPRHNSLCPVLRWKSALKEDESHALARAIEQRDALMNCLLEAIRAMARHDPAGAREWIRRLEEARRVVLG